MRISTSGKWKSERVRRGRYKSLQQWCFVLHLFIRVQKWIPMDSTTESVHRPSVRLD